MLDIFSPELLTGQQNLLFLIKNDRANTPLINAVKQRLLLLGTNNNQLQKVIATGKAIFSVTVYSNYTGHVHEAGNNAKNVTVEIPDIPGKKFAGKIHFRILN